MAVLLLHLLSCHYICRGKTLGVVGYGDIGQETANIARAFKMNIVALRRRKELSQHDKDLNLKVCSF